MSPPWANGFDSSIPCGKENHQKMYHRASEESRAVCKLIGPIRETVAIISTNKKEHSSQKLNL